METSSSLALMLMLLTTVSAFNDVVQPKGFTLASNHFGFNLYRQLSRENAAKQNLFFSPLSIATGLAMLHEGSDGNTAKQLRSTVGFEEAGLTDPAREVQQTTLALKPSESEMSYKFQSANALLVSDQADVKESFKNALQSSFNGELFTAKGAETMSLINGWVANKTEGRIAQLLSQPPQLNAQAMLLNAVYFKGTWRHKFDKEDSKMAPFYGVDNKTTDVKFMEKKRKWMVAELKELDAIMLEMPYIDGNTSLYAILPNDRRSDLTLLRKVLHPYYAESLMTRFGSEECTVIFPKLDFITNYEMVSTLQALGVVDAFGSRANLSRIADGPLMVSKAVHKATLQVDEEGSTATAAFYVEMVLTSALIGGGPPPVYRFDHPFVFFIRHRPTGQILFLGEINQL